jgi:uncharacterized RDD family membrane protein YckC
MEDKDVAPRLKRKRRPLHARGFDVSRPPHGDLAPWWRRVVAYLIDTVILVAITAPLYTLLSGHSYFLRIDTASEIEKLAVVSVVAGLYFGSIMKRTNGSTVGKRLLAIRVVSTGGHKMTFTRAAWREVGVVVILYNLLRIVPVFGGVLGVAIPFADGIWPLWDRENRALRDFMAGTRVRTSDPLLPASSWARHPPSESGIQAALRRRREGSQER